VEKVGIFNGHSEYNIANWCTLWQFGNFVTIRMVYFYPILVYCVKKNLATLIKSCHSKSSEASGYLFRHL
jgi:hypothetical protein